MSQLDLDGQDSTDYRDPETLRRLYWDEGLELKEIGDIFGVHATTIHTHMKNHGIDRRPRGGPRNRYASYDTDQMGYERWKDKYDGEEITVRVHQLLAIAIGHDPHEVFGGENHVHHRDGIPFHNTPSNIELLNKKEHISAHSKGENNPNSIFTNSDVRDIRERLSNGEHPSEISKDYGCSDHAIWQIKWGKTWSHVD